MECFCQVPVLFCLALPKPIPCSFRGLPTRVFSATATDRTGDREENFGLDTKDKRTRSISSSRNADDVLGTEPPSFNQTPSDVKDERPIVKDLLQNPFAQTDSLHIGFKENGIPVPIVEAALHIKRGSLTTDIVGQVLRSAIDDWELGLRVFLWVRQQPSYRHNSETLELMIHILGKAQRFQIMWQLIEEVKKEAYLIRPKIFEVIVRSYIKAGCVEAAVDALERMKDFSCCVGTSGLNALVRVLCYEKRIEDCQLIIERLKDTYRPNEITYSILIHGWCEANKLSKALETLEGMIQEGIQPTLGAYTSLIETLCAANLVEIANKLFSYMKNNILYKLRETKVTANTSEDLAIVSEVTPTLDSVTYNCFITSLCTLGEVDDACELLEMMVKKGFTPNTKTYSFVFTQLCKRRKAREAFELYNNVAATDFFPTLQIHDNLIEMFCCTGHVDMALELWNKMHEKQYSCGHQSYSVLIHGLCYNSLFKEAFVHLKKMIEKGIVPLYQTYRMLHFGFLKDGDMQKFNELKEIIQQFEEKGIQLAMPRKQWRKR